MGEDARSVKNPIHVMDLWQQRVYTELATASEWEAKWGFLKAPRRPLNKLKADDQLGATSSNIAASTSMPTLGSAGRAALRPTNDLNISSDDRSRVLMNRRYLTPKERYGRQMTDAHEVGWRTTLERFGVSHHGIKRDTGIWPTV
mmetsp:Transcript_98495/g.228363  ORF Transcript_98495/g.228363 Transcript_98495/m.228363 type:complete len:145 (+) Transcript_98495:57-491(+)